MNAFLSPFLHAGAEHLIANIIGALLFIPRLFRAVGMLRLVLLFMAAGIAGNAVAEWISARPVIGASAGVSGLMGAHLVLCPRARLANLPIAPMIALQALIAGINSVLGGIAWHAHLIGAALGIMAAICLRAVRRRR